MSTVVTELVAVAFEGEGSGVGELTWSQQSIWADMERAGISLAMTAVRQLAPGTAMEDLMAEYSFYLSRYQAMRTLLRFEPDGRVRQVVHGSGTAEIKIYDAGDRDPAEVAAEVELQYGFSRFDYEHEWPMRTALVRRDGVLTHAVVAISHHAADATAAMSMFEDLRDRDPRTGLPPRPPGIQPLAQARLQQTPSALRQNAAALRYWEDQLRVIPPAMFPPRPGIPPPQERYWYAEFSSPAMYPALRATAARLGVSTGPVLYAAFATALAHVTGVNPVATMITVNNRFRPGLANAAGHMVQHGLCTLDVLTDGFDELVGKARRRLLIAQKNGYYVPADVEALVERIGRERGVSFDLLCLYNDRRKEDPAEPASLPTSQDSTLTWRNVDHLHHRVIFHANDSAEAVIALQVQADTAYLGRAEVGALLQQVERLVTGSAARVDA